MLAAIVLLEGIGSRIFVDFQLVRQLVRHRWYAGALRIDQGGRALVIGRAGSEHGAVQGAFARPVHECIDLAMRAIAGKLHRLRGERLARLQAVRNRQGMRLAVLTLFPDAEQSLFFHQPVAKIPVVLVLRAIRLRRQGLREFELEPTFRLGVGIENIGEDFIDRFVLPDALVAAEFQEIHPRREADLITG